MKTSVQMYVKSVSDIQQEYTLSIPDCDIKLNHSYNNPDDYVLRFQTNKRTTNKLLKSFGKHVFVLRTIKDGYFPTPILLNNVPIAYDFFIELLQQNKLSINTVITEVRNQKFGPHEIIINRVIAIICEKVSV